MRAIAEEITALVMEFGGGLSGEHGDGRARSPFNETLYGPRLYDAFRQVKRAFDPKGILNPGNIVDAPPMTEHLRYGPEYRAWEPETLLDFSGQGGFAAAVEMCNGIGVCRKKLEGTMCPSYMATLDEEHSTRGRANALRAVLSGKVPRSEFTGAPALRGAGPLPRVQGLQGRVPGQRRHGEAQVRVPRPLLPGERPAPPQPALRPHPHAGPRSARPWRPCRTGSRARRPTGGSSSAWPASTGAARCPRSRPSRSRGGSAAGGPRGTGARGEVVLFHDTFNTYQTPGVAIAATRLLETLGYRVVLADRGCCGRPMISKGMLDEARALAADNVARLAGAARQGRPIVGLEPSCLLTLRDEYPELVRTEDARLVARQSFLLEEFLQKELGAGERPRFGRERPPGARSCSTATATRRRWSARPRRWRCSRRRATR